MQFSIIIPARNEQESIKYCVETLLKSLKDNEFEIVVINDFSTDQTESILKKCSEIYNNVKYFNNISKGLGRAINLGIDKAEGKYICIIMSDLSDDVEDIKKYFKIVSSENYDAVFGSRFLKESKVCGYPKKKLILNRIANYLIKILFFSDYNDFTNAFKIYKKDVLIKTKPLISESFNIFLEMPLKIVSRKFSYKIIPINWNDRKKGESKFIFNELKSKYLFTLLYCFLEKILLKK